MLGGSEHPGGIHRNQNRGSPGNEKRTLVKGGKLNRTMPEPRSPQPLQPTRTRTTVGSEESLSIIVIHVLVIHSGWPDTIVTWNPSGGFIIVKVTPDTLLSAVVEVAGRIMAEPVIDRTVAMFSIPSIESEVVGASVVMAPSVLKGTPESTE